MIGARTVDPPRTEALHQDPLEALQIQSFHSIEFIAAACFSSQHEVTTARVVEELWRHRIPLSVMTDLPSPL